MYKYSINSREESTNVDLLSSILADIKECKLDLESSDLIDVKTDIGIGRKVNQDFTIVFDKNIIVCDGMGGFNGGEISSRIVAYTFYELYSKLSQDFISNLDTNNQLESFIESLLTNVQDIYLERLKKHFPELLSNKSGTTFSACLHIQDNRYLCVTIGDSMIYKCILNGYNEKLSPNTHDENLFEFRHSEFFSELDKFIETDPSRSNLISTLENFKLQYPSSLLICDYLINNFIFLASDYEMRFKILNSYKSYVRSLIGKEFGHQIFDCFSNLGLKKPNLMIKEVELNSDEFLLVCSDGLSDNVCLDSLKFSSVPNIESLLFLSKKIMSDEIDPSFDLDNFYVKSSKWDNVTVGIVKHDSMIPSSESTIFDELFMYRLRSEDLKLKTETYVFTNSVSVDEYPGLIGFPKQDVIKTDPTIKFNYDLTGDYLNYVNLTFSPNQARVISSFISANTQSIRDSLSGHNITVGFDFGLNIGSEIYMVSSVGAEYFVMKMQVFNIVDNYYSLRSYFRRSLIEVSFSTLDLIHRSAVTKMRNICDYNYLDYIQNFDDEFLNYNFFSFYIDQKSSNLLEFNSKFRLLDKYPDEVLTVGTVVAYLDDFGNFKITVLESVINDVFKFQNEDEFNFLELKLRGIHVYSNSNQSFYDMDFYTVLNLMTFLQDMNMMNLQFAKFFDQFLRGPYMSAAKVEDLLRFKIDNDLYIRVLKIRISKLSIPEILTLWKQLPDTHYSFLFEEILSK